MLLLKPREEELPFLFMIANLGLKKNRRKAR